MTLERRIKQLGEIDYLEIPSRQQWGRYLPTYKVGKKRYIRVYTISREEAEKVGLNSYNVSRFLNYDKQEIDLSRRSSSPLWDDILRNVVARSHYWQFNDRRVHQEHGLKKPKRKVFAGGGLAPTGIAPIIA